MLLCFVRSPPSNRAFDGVRLKIVVILPIEEGFPRVHKPRSVGEENAGTGGNVPQFFIEWKIVSVLLVYRF